MTASTERSSPLAEWSARFAATGERPDAFTIREVRSATQVNLRGNAADAAFAEAVRAVLGCALPTDANTWNEGNDCATLWLGPDEWLVVAPEGRNASLYGALHAALRSIHHAVTDVSANRTIIEISGEHARLVLAKGCPLDLHGSAFGPPQCAQTLLAKAQMILQCIDARPTFRVFVRISFAPYVGEWLLDAATECAAARDLDTQRIARRAS